MKFKGFSHLPAVKKIGTSTNVFGIKDKTSSKNRKCDCCKKRIKEGEFYQQVCGSQFGIRRVWVLCKDCSIPKNLKEQE
jgi:hypothetical protein